MPLSRRQFFKGVTFMAGAIGMSRLVQGDEAWAHENETVGDGSVEIEWLGHGSFQFTSCKGKRILLDPWFSTNPKCPTRYRKKGSFGSVDFILWTHGHVDHFMLPDAKELVADYKPKIVAPWELSFFIKTQIPGANCQTFVLGNKGATADFDGVKITMVEAFHSAGAQLTGFEGVNRFMGEAVGYIIEFENGLKVYHSGDTSLTADMKTIIADFYKPDVAILPIGGVFTMGPEEAAFACKLIKPKIIIPEHFGTFPVLEQNTDVLKEKLDQYAPGVEMMEVKPGVKVNV